MSSSQQKILLTGATGYIGGSVLAQLLSSPSASKYTPISCLVRGQEKADALSSKFGDAVTPVLFEDLEDTERIIDVASQHDIVINTTLGYHAGSAKAIVLGLAKRKQQTGKDVFMIHTSGTSNLADQPISGKYVESDPGRVFSDRDDDIYSYEQTRNAAQPYPQRTAELGVIDTGLETGVKTLVIMSPTIYGLGLGEFNRLTIQVPLYIRATLKHGYAVRVGDGKGVWDHVHIADLARLYQIVLDAVLGGGQDLPFGKQGILFSGAGRHSWGEVAQGVADAAHQAGKIKSNEVRSVNIAEAAKILGIGNELMVELGFSSNSRTQADVARSLGWKPEKGVKEWQAHFAEEVKEEVARGLHKAGL